METQALLPFVAARLQAHFHHIFDNWGTIAIAGDMLDCVMHSGNLAALGCKFIFDGIGDVELEEGILDRTALGEDLVEIAVEIGVNNFVDLSIV